ncbi:MAG: Rv1355c family protein [Bacteroidetes bacterium]|nr:Rv1355c family protein [Bacteroidota bacterium]
MKHQLEKLIKQNKSGKEIFQPSFYRLNDPAGSDALKNLITAVPEINVFDEILGQVEEYVKSTNPKIVFSKSELTEAAKKHIGSIPYEEYGVWVYYPWSKRLVHMLDEKEFVEVRTNRNMYKITPQEKAVLATKRIGVIGLSVGQSVSLTIAMERSCGELRLADYDILELSNYNRIRTGLHNLNLPKVISVAREIAEIDPFLKVNCYHEGITEENINDFLLKDGKLDILIDECDGLYVKILCRQKAKQLGIPVVMEASDRGTIDVERFDLEPTRPILHGFIDHLDLSKVKEAKTNEQKVPYLLPIAGEATLSHRFKASMLEIEQTVTTWPQLASAVTLGGGITADVCRRIALNQFHDSGRYFVDIEEAICDKKKEKTEEKPLDIKPPLSKEEMKALIQNYSTPLINDQIDLKKETVEILVHAAILAPSGANSQTWQWVYQNSCLYLFLENQYDAALLDYKHTTTIMGLGSATENLIIKAHELGIEVMVEQPHLDEKSILISVFRFFNHTKVDLKTEPHICDDLVKSIPHRMTNRNIEQKRHLIDKETLAYIRTLACSIPGADLKIIDDEKNLLEIGEVIAKMDRIRVMHEGGHMDFRAECRWTIEEVEQTKNGIDVLRATDLTPSELAGFQMIKNWHVVKLLNDWGGGRGLEKVARKQIQCASAVGLITMPAFDCKNFYDGGRALQRIWLGATKENICVHPTSIATLTFNAFVHSGEHLFPEKMRNEIKELRQQFCDLFSITKPIGEVLLLRFFKSGPPKGRSLRYPLGQILHFT